MSSCCVSCVVSRANTRPFARRLRDLRLLPTNFPRPRDEAFQGWSLLLSGLAQVRLPARSSSPSGLKAAFRIWTSNRHALSIARIYSSSIQSSPLHSSSSGFPDAFTGRVQQPSCCALCQRSRACAPRFLLYLPSSRRERSCLQTCPSVLPFFTRLLGTGIPQHSPRPSLTRVLAGHRDLLPARDDTSSVTADPRPGHDAGLLRTRGFLIGEFCCTAHRYSRLAR